MQSFRFLPFIDLENNFKMLVSVELKGKGLQPHEFGKLPENRQRQLTSIAEKIAQLKENKVLSDEKKAKTVTGACLVAEMEIKKEYEKGLYKYLPKYFSDPNNSAVHKSIRSTIGEAEGNKLDKASENEAIDAFNRYLSLPNEIKHFQSSSLKHVDAKVKQVPLAGSHIRDIKDFKRASLKHVEPQVKLALLRMTDFRDPTPYLDEEGKERYKKYRGSERAYFSFRIKGVFDRIEKFNSASLRHTETVVKQAPLAKEDMTDPTRYMDEEGKARYKLYSLFKTQIHPKIEARRKPEQEEVVAQALPSNKM